MTPDEVRMLDNGKALLFIRGELPVCDDKFDIMTHPLVSHTLLISTEAPSTPLQRSPFTTGF